MTEHNLPEPDDAPWLNLTQEEVEELRNKKHELTEYGKQKLRELMNKDLIFYTNGKETSRMPAPTLETLTTGTKAPEIKLEIKMTEPIEAKVSEEDFNKIVDAFNNPQPYPDEMFEEAERREAERKALDAVEKLYKENGDALKQLAEIEKEEREKLNAGFKQDADGNWYRPTLQELTRNERIELAEKEIAYIVMGGQDGREYANSIAFILQVLDSLRDD
jgi:hypothetical protein